MIDGTKQKRHREHIHCRHESSDQRHIGTIEIDGADAGLFNGFLFLAELARMKNPELVTSSAALLAQAAHVSQRLYGWIVFALGVGDAKLTRHGGRRDRRRTQRDNDGDDRYVPRKVGAAIHGQLHPLLMMSMDGKKGSTLSGRSRRETAIVPAPAASSMVRCEGLCGMATAGMPVIHRNDSLRQPAYQLSSPRTR